MIPGGPGWKVHRLAQLLTRHLTVIRLDRPTGAPGVRPNSHSGLPAKRVKTGEVGCPRPARQSLATRRPAGREVELGGVEPLVLQLFTAIAGQVFRLTAAGPLVARAAEVGGQIVQVQVILHLLQVKRPVLPGGGRSERLG